MKQLPYKFKVTITRKSLRDAVQDTLKHLGQPGRYCVLTKALSAVFPNYVIRHGYTKASIYNKDMVILGEYSSPLAQKVVFKFDAAIYDKYKKMFEKQLLIVLEHLIGIELEYEQTKI